MAHFKITVEDVGGPRALAQLFDAAARLDIRVHAGRLLGRRVVLELEEGAPVADLERVLAAQGIEVEVAPGEHLTDALSGRERELVVHLAAGLQLKEVAQRMGVQTHTAREYWLRVKRKWDVKTVGQAVAIWTEHGHTHEATGHRR